MKKKFLLSLTCTMMAFSCLPSNVFASALPSTEVSQNVEARKDDIRYQYKMIGEDLYRRLYNFSKGKPVSDWVIVK